MRISTRRHKLSTTVSRDTHEYLEALVESGRAATIAEAVDLAVLRVRRTERRAMLERDTAAYFEGLPGKSASEESRLEDALGLIADEVHFDH
jgi:hypothetical protein